MKFEIWDKVRHTQSYIDDRELATGIPYPFIDIYTIKKQITAIAYLADGEKPENKDVILNPWGLEKIEE